MQPFKIKGVFVVLTTILLLSGCGKKDLGTKDAFDTSDTNTADAVAATDEAGKDKYGKNAFEDWDGTVSQEDQAKAAQLKDKYGKNAFEDWDGTAPQTNKAH